MGTLALQHCLWHDQKLAYDRDLVSVILLPCVHDRLCHSLMTRALE